MQNHLVGLSLLMLFVLGQISLVPAFAQVDSWQSNMNEANALYTKSNYKAAIEKSNAAVKALETAGIKDEKLAITLLFVADCHLLQKDYAKAQPYYERGLEMFSANNIKHTSSSIPIEIKALKDLASLYFEQGRFTDTERLSNQALSLSRSSNEPVVASSLDHLAILYAKQGKFAEAEPLLIRAVEIQEKAVPANHAELADSLTILADMYRAQGKSADAVAAEQRLRKIKNQ